MRPVFHSEFYFGLLTTLIFFLKLYQFVYIFIYKGSWLEGMRGEEEDRKMNGYK